MASERCPAAGVCEEKIPASSSFAITATVPPSNPIHQPPSLAPTPAGLILHRFCAARQYKIAAARAQPAALWSSRALLSVATKLIVNAARDQTSSFRPPLRRPLPSVYSYSRPQRPSLRASIIQHGLQFQLVAVDCGHRSGARHAYFCAEQVA